MTTHLISEETKGVYVISPTPFADNGDVNHDSVDNLVDFYLEKGIDGFTILGILGEATKLSPEESARFMLRYLAASTVASRRSSARAIREPTISSASLTTRWRPARRA